MWRVVLLLVNFNSNRPALIDLQNPLQLAVPLHQDCMVLLQAAVLYLEHFEHLSGENVVRDVFVLRELTLKQLRQAGHSFAQKAVRLARYFFHLTVFLL
jgi:hypothetical protein